jgi:hypothetical protein
MVAPTTSPNPFAFTPIILGRSSNAISLFVPAAPPIQAPADLKAMKRMIIQQPVGELSSIGATSLENRRAKFKQFYWVIRRPGVLRRLKSRKF